LAGRKFTVNVPGRHNVANAMAALAVGRALGIPLEDCARGIAAYRGVERRHVKVGEAGGITVVDDFAHNPAKVKACLETVKRSADGKPRRVLALFHPHGFAPMKLMGEDLVVGMAEALDAGDRVFLPEIYYAGGTADKSISSADLVASLNRRKAIGSFHATKDEAIAAVAAEARPGDWVVTMGARDPSLGEFALKLFQAIAGRIASAS
jgi:UDP-N-acetylmuramate--alanine ligase